MRASLDISFIKGIPNLLAATLVTLHCCGEASATDGEFKMKLSGMVTLPDWKCALLETGRLPHEQPILLLGEGICDGGVEMVEINPSIRSVRLNLLAKGGAVTSSMALTNQALSSNSGVSLDSVQLDWVLRLFGDLTNRMLLRWPQLPKITLTINAAATNRAGAAQVLQAALAEKGISVIPDGNHFLMVLPREEASNVKTLASRIKTTAPDAAGVEIIEAGMIFLLNMDVEQVLQLYAALVGRKLLPFERGAGYPRFGVTLQNQIPLSKDEAIYAMETVLGWAGVEINPIGEDGLRVVQIPKNR
jgi:hypothetical protein